MLEIALGEASTAVLQDPTQLSNELIFRVRWKEIEDEQRNITFFIPTQSNHENREICVE
jgi:hypothetical protein